MQRLIRLFRPQVPEGVRLISEATSLRWFGWGFSEAFIPVFLFSFVHTYAETGILRSIYGIVFLLSLPIISWFADRIPSKNLMLAALLMYPFISVSYFFAGIAGIVALVVLARFINGIAYALDSVGRATYIRSSSDERIATSFGFVDTMANFWWLVAVFISVILIKHIPVSYLFLFIIPTALGAIFFVRKIPNNVATINREKHSFIGSYRDFFTTIWSWGKDIRWLAFISLLAGIVATISEFFVPIYAYANGQGLVKVVLLTAFATLPSLFGAPLGIIADRNTKRSLMYGSIVITLLLLSLAITSLFTLQLIIVFVIGIALQLISLAIDKEISVRVSSENLGSLSGAFQGISQLSEIVGPIILGVSIDLFKLPITVTVLGALFFVFTGIFLWKKI